MKFDLYFAPNTKINFRGAANLNINCKSIKSLDDNV